MFRWAHRWLDSLAAGDSDKIWEALERIAAKSRVDLSDVRVSDGHRHPDSSRG